MAKWLIYENRYGNNEAFFRADLNGTMPDGSPVLRLEAKMIDFDGDTIHWWVRENGRPVAQGEVLPNGETIEAEEIAWEEAKKRAEYVICYGTDESENIKREDMMTNAFVPSRLKSDDFEEQNTFNRENRVLPRRFLRTYSSDEAVVIKTNPLSRYGISSAFD